MSKYRLTPVFSRYRLAFLCLVYLGTLAAVWLCKPDVIPRQIWVQSGLSLCVLLGWYKDGHKAFARRDWETVWLVDEQGRFESIRPDYLLRILGPNSKVTPFLLWLELCDGLDRPRRQWRWVFRDQLDEQAYRRLCRIILKVQTTGAG